MSANIREIRPITRETSMKIEKLTGLSVVGRPVIYLTDDVHAEHHLQINMMMLSDALYAKRKDW